MSTAATPVTDLFPFEETAASHPDFDFEFPLSETVVPWGKSLTFAGENLRCRVEFSATFDRKDDAERAAFEICFGSRRAEAQRLGDVAEAAGQSRWTARFAAEELCDQHAVLSTKLLLGREDVGDGDGVYVISRPTLTPLDPTTMRLVGTAWRPYEHNYAYLDQYRRFLAEDFPGGCSCVVVSTAYFRDIRSLGPRDIFLVWDYHLGVAPHDPEQQIQFLRDACCASEPGPSARVLVMFEPPTLHGNSTAWILRPDVIAMFDFVFGPVDPVNTLPRVEAFWAPTHHALFQFSREGEVSKEELALFSETPSWKNGEQPLLAINPISSTISWKRVNLAMHLLDEEPSAKVFGREALWIGNKLVDAERYGGCGEIADKLGAFPERDRNPAKIEMFRPFRFVFVAENTDDWMVSEKLFDMTITGNLAVYRGPRQISRMFPQLFGDPDGDGSDAAYVDARKFATVSELVAFMRSMPEEEYRRRWQRARDSRDEILDGMTRGATWRFVFGTLAQHGRFLVRDPSAQERVRAQSSWGLLSEVNRRLKAPGTPAAAALPEPSEPEVHPRLKPFMPTDAWTQSLD